MKTDYSDSDFKVKWKKLRSVNTENEFLISVYPGKRFNGKLKMRDANKVAIIKNKDTLSIADLIDIVSLREVKTSFLNKLNGELGVGLNLTKAEEMKEFSLRSRLGYQAERWKLTASYDEIRSTRKNSKMVKRMDAALDYQYYLRNNWFTITQLSFFSNNEQKIDLRVLGLGGIGKMLVQNDKWYWTVFVGATYNNENYSSKVREKARNSSEGLVGTEISLFDVTDFSLLSRAVAYPSLTSSNRWRLDYDMDVKYNLPLDFFIKLGFSFNYDNKPVDQASSTDYIFQTTIGWDFN